LTRSTPSKIHTWIQLVDDVIQGNALQVIFRKKSATLSFGSLDTSPTADIVMPSGSATPITTDTYQISSPSITEFCQKIAPDVHNPQRIKMGCHHSERS